MLAFYLDETLSAAEQADVLEQLADFGEDIRAGLEFKRIPFVFPVEGCATDNEILIEKFSGHLRNAGARTGQRCLFILPKEDSRWALLLQMAFERTVGRFPYLVQPWSWNEVNEQPVRSEWIRVTNLNGMMTGG